MITTKFAENDVTTMPISPYLHTVDVVVMRFVSSKVHEDVAEDRIEVLVHKRDREPFMGQWALPGLVINGDTQDATIEDAAMRLMASPKVNMTPVYMEQVGSLGSAVRDPRCWSSTTFYLAIVGPDTKPGEGQKFLPMDDIIDGVFPLPFDHQQLVAKADERLYSKSLYSSLPLKMLGSLLTLTEAIDVTSCILRRPVQKSSMRSRFTLLTSMGYLKETGEVKPMPVGRPQTLLRNLSLVNLNDIYFFDRSFEK